MILSQYNESNNHDLDFDENYNAYHTLIHNLKYYGTHDFHAMKDKIFEKKNSDFLEAEIMKSSEAGTIIQGKKYEGLIINKHAPFLLIVFFLLFFLSVEHVNDTYWYVTICICYLGS